MTALAYLQVLISILLLLTVVVFLSGASRFGASWSTQRLISGKPREWFSAEHVHRRRQAAIDFLTPAIVAYCAAIAAEVGINQLEGDWRGWGRLLESQGFALIAGGALVIFVTAIAAISRTPRNPWTLVDNSEALLLFIRGARGPVNESTYESWQRRFAEITERETADSNKGIRAHRYWPAEPQTLGKYPNPLTGTITDRRGNKSHGPTLRTTHRWSWHTSKAATITAYAGLAAALGWAVMIAWAIIYDQTWTPFLLGWFSLMGLFLAAGVYLFICGMRLDLIWWSRYATERDEFRKEIKKLLAAYATNRAPSDGETLVRELNRLLGSLTGDAAHELRQSSKQRAQSENARLLGVSVLFCVLGVSLGRRSVARGRAGRNQARV